MKVKISRTPKRVKVESDKIPRPRYFKTANRAFDFAISLTDSSTPFIDWDDRKPDALVKSCTKADADKVKE